MRKLKIHLWKCPKCGREFERHDQAHSCRVYPLELHFKGKESSKTLYKKLCTEIRKEVGSFKVDSLECCIHLVSTSTFTAVKILQHKLQIDFSLNHEIKNKRFIKSLKMSENRYLYLLEITKEEEINDELLNWLQEAQKLKETKIINQT
jgi:hypothetical protein